MNRKERDLYNGNWAYPNERAATKLMRLGSFNRVFDDETQGKTALPFCLAIVNKLLETTNITIEQFESSITKDEITILRDDGNIPYLLYTGIWHNYCALNLHELVLAAKPKVVALLRKYYFKGESHE